MENERAKTGRPTEMFITPVQSRGYQLRVKFQVFVYETESKLETRAHSHTHTHTAKLWPFIVVQLCCVTET